MRWALVLMIASACEREPLERLEAPPPAPVLAPSQPAPPPPPPPTAIESPAAVPLEIAKFLRANSDPLRVTLYSLGDDDGPFLGGKVLRSRQLADASAAEVLAWLGDDKTYVTENGTRGCGWVTPELGIEVARGNASLRLRYNCGYLFFDKNHDVKATVGSDGIVRFMAIEDRSGFRR